MPAFAGMTFWSVWSVVVTVTRQTTNHLVIPVKTGIWKPIMGLWHISNHSLKNAFYHLAIHHSINPSILDLSI